MHITAYLWVFVLLASLAQARPQRKRYIPRAQQKQKNPHTADAPSETSEASNSNTSDGSPPQDRNHSTPAVIPDEASDTPDEAEPVAKIEAELPSSDPGNGGTSEAAAVESEIAAASEQPAAEISLAEPVALEVPAEVASVASEAAVDSVQIEKAVEIFVASETPASETSAPEVVNEPETSQDMETAPEAIFETSQVPSIPSADEQIKTSEAGLPAEKPARTSETVVEVEPVRIEPAVEEEPFRASEEPTVIPESPEEEKEVFVASEEKEEVEPPVKQVLAEEEQIAEIPEIAPQPAEEPEMRLPGISPAEVTEQLVPEISEVASEAASEEATEEGTREENFGASEEEISRERMAVALGMAAVTAWLLSGKKSEKRGGKISVSHIFKDHQPHPLEQRKRSENPFAAGRNFQVVENVDKEVVALRSRLQTLMKDTEIFESQLADGFGKILRVLAAEEASTASG